MKLFLEANKKIFIASPTRGISDNLKKFIIPTNKDNKVFPRQRAWERFYFYKAARKGCIMFWLPKEAEKKDPNKIYAHITMLEIGLWIARVKANPDIKIVIGTDWDFPEWSTIEDEIKNEIPWVKICYSLADTTKSVLELMASESDNL